MSEKQPSTPNDVLSRKHRRGVTWLELAVEYAEETVENGPSGYVAAETAEAVAQVLLALVAERKSASAEKRDCKRCDYPNCFCSTTNAAPQGQSGHRLPCSPLAGGDAPAGAALPDDKQCMAAADVPCFAPNCSCPMLPSGDCEHDWSRSSGAVSRRSSTWRGCSRLAPSLAMACGCLTCRRHLSRGA